jgi:hypothetical protein
MGKKHDRNKIPLPAGQTIVIFDGPEDLSALPRHQRRLREKYREKERRKVWQTHQRDQQTAAQAVEADLKANQEAALKASNDT